MICVSYYRIKCTELSDKCCGAKANAVHVLSGHAGLCHMW